MQTSVAMEALDAQPGATMGTARPRQGAAPLVGAAFLGVSLLAWRFGVRHYRSTGS